MAALLAKREPSCASTDYEAGEVNGTFEANPPPSFGDRLEKFLHSASEALGHSHATPNNDSTSSLTSTSTRVLRPRATDRVSKTTSTNTTRAPSPRKPITPSRRSTNSSKATSTSTIKTRKITSRSPSNKTPSKYAPPSKYAHLPPLPDILSPNLICIFIGTNPGIRTAQLGHAYAHPSNQFWKLLHSSGCTPRRCSPSEDVDLPHLFSMGNTNIVDRPTRDAAELSKKEMEESARVLDRKIRRYKPEAVCIVGKGIWEAIWRARHGRNLGKGEFRYGWQDEGENMGLMKVEGDVKVEKQEIGEGEEDEWKGSRVFVATSTSGLAASTRPAEKEAIWKPFGEWVKRRREERAAAEQQVKVESVEA